MMFPFSENQGGMSVRGTRPQVANTYPTAQIGGNAFSTVKTIEFKFSAIKTNEQFYFADSAAGVGCNISLPTEQ